MVLHRFDERSGVLDRSLEEDPMSKVRDVSGRVAPRVEHRARFRDDALARAEQETGIEVSLKRDATFRTSAGVDEIGAPVDAKDVRAG